MTTRSAEALAAESEDRDRLRPSGDTRLALQGDRLAKSAEGLHTAVRAYGILVVDDEPSVRAVLDLALRHQGFVVWLAADGRKALDLYRRHRETIDVVLLDVRMPGIDGPSTLLALQEINPQVRCSFMSGDLGDYTEEGLRRIGASAVLSKPFRLAEIARVLWVLATNADPISPGLCPPAVLESDGEHRQEVRHAPGDERAALVTGT